jgi:hypothetical protein
LRTGWEAWIEIKGREMLDTPASELDEFECIEAANVKNPSVPLEGTVGAYLLPCSSKHSGEHGPWHTKPLSTSGRAPSLGWNNNIPASIPTLSAVTMLKGHRKSAFSTSKTRGALVLEEERRRDTHGHIFGTAMSDLARAFVLEGFRGVEGATKQIRPALPEPSEGVALGNRPFAVQIPGSAHLPNVRGRVFR